MGYYEIEHHNLDPYPVPKEKEPLYVNCESPAGNTGRLCRTFPV